MGLPTARDVHLESALSAVSIAYRNEAYIGEQVFPRVGVEKKSDYYFVFGRSAWFRDEVKVRAPGTRAKRIGYDLSSASYVCTEYAVAHPLPDEVRENADNPLRPEVESSELVTDALIRAQERRIAELVGGSANWANAASPGTQWDDDTSDPLGDIETARNSVISSIGREPNILVMGHQAWKELKHHPDLLDRIKFFQSGVLTVDLAAGLFEVEKLLVGRSLYDSAAEGATAAMTFIWGKWAWLGYVPATPSLYVPAAGYCLEWKGREVRRYREEQEHQDIFEARHSTGEVITASEAGYCIPSAVA